MIWSILIGFLFLLLVLGLFVLIPYVKKRKAQIIIVISLIVFCAIVLLFPKQWFINIPLPIINDSLSGFTIDFLSKSKHYGELIKFDAIVEENILSYVTLIVKGVICLIVVGLTILISSLTLLIISFVKKRGKNVKKIFATLVLFISSCAILISPLYSVAILYDSMNKNLGNKNQTILETYPGYKEYEKVLSFLDSLDGALSVISDYEAFDLLKTPLNAMSLGAYHKLNNDLENIDALLNKLKYSGATVIYSDDTFDFKETKKDTFDFDALIELVDDVNNSNVYSNVSRTFTNQILKSLSEVIEKDVNKGKLSLELSEEDFLNQYKDILKLLQFVVDSNLLDAVNNSTLANLINVATSVFRDNLTIPNFFKSEIVLKIKSYMGNGDKGDLYTIEAALYTTSKLCEAMNLWLDTFKETEFYSSTSEFLVGRGII